mmetsp:Transcript_69413/g.190536  ORF Transcript_69413/g.190536 Transcript_69413/m.190536 type:complete len:365 (-) Transcript_69413:652-1746(-)
MYRHSVDKCLRRSAGIGPDDSISGVTLDTPLLEACVIAAGSEAAMRTRWEAFMQPSDGHRSWNRLEDGEGWEESLNGRHLVGERLTLQLVHDRLQGSVCVRAASTRYAEESTSRNARLISYRDEQDEDDDEEEHDMWAKSVALLCAAHQGAVIGRLVDIWQAQRNDAVAKVLQRFQLAPNAIMQFYQTLGMTSVDDLCDSPMLRNIGRRTCFDSPAASHEARHAFTVGDRATTHGAVAVHTRMVAAVRDARQHGRNTLAVLEGWEMFVRSPEGQHARKHAKTNTARKALVDCDRLARQLPELKKLSTAPCCIATRRRRRRGHASTPLLPHLARVVCCSAQPRRASEPQTRRRWPRWGWTSGRSR